MPLIALYGKQQPPVFTLITMPKSGSHLLIKAIYLLTKTEAIWHTKFPSYQYVPSDEGFLYTHFCLSPELEADYAELPQLKKIILIRDLRDVAISMVHQIKKAPWPGLTHEQRQEFLSMSFAEQLLFVINFEYDVQAVAKTAPNSLQVSLTRVATQALNYTQKPDVVTFRYEDLVGPQGGGTLSAQLEQMKKLKEFLKLDVSETMLETVALKLYGDEINPFGHNNFKNFRSTFQFGVINRWKDVFTEEHKAAFKNKLGDQLISLGYEEDENW